MKIIPEELVRLLLLPQKCLRHLSEYQRFADFEFQKLTTAEQPLFLYSDKLLRLLHVVRLFYPVSTLTIDIIEKYYRFRMNKLFGNSFTKYKMVVVLATSQS